MSILQAWDISEAGALRALDQFMSEGLAKYEGQRQYADARAVSRLSPYLRFGQLSARLLWHKMREAR
jgi:deoxyribodipyrimidine photo-lyase